jgi:hypothetical protein
MDPQLALMIVGFFAFLLAAAFMFSSRKPKGTFEAAKLHHKVDHMKENSAREGKVCELEQRVADYPRMIEESERKARIEKLEAEYQKTGSVNPGERGASS